MDKKKTLSLPWLATVMLLCLALPLQAQKVKGIEFCGKTLIEGTDSIALHLKLLDDRHQAVAGMSADKVKENLRLYEDGTEPDDKIGSKHFTVRTLNGGQRIGDDYTFSVLIDRHIPDKDRVMKAVEELVKAAPEGCVFVSFYGDDVTSSEAVTAQSLPALRAKLDRPSATSYFFSGVYAKLTEFDAATTDDSALRLQDGYTRNADIAARAARNPGKNFLFIFADGSLDPVYEGELSGIDRIAIRGYQRRAPESLPRLYAFYFTGAGSNEDMRETLDDAAMPTDSVTGQPLEGRTGKFFETDDMNAALGEFRQAVASAAYDYDFVYQVPRSKVYNGRAVHYMAKWDGEEIGETDMTIGSSEDPFPHRDESAVLKYLMALLVALLTFAVFFIVAKIIVPAIKSKSFKLKYYKPFVPKPGVNRYICRYCAQDILPGQQVVVKCEHVMHSHCWQQNNYHCTDYGQRCKTGSQPHVDLSRLFTAESMRESNQTLAGILAALVSWVVYELTGRGGVFGSMAQKIAGLSLTSDHALWADAVSRIGAFLAIGTLLGFFLSLIFRYNDEYRSKNALVILKILGLSLLSSLIGLVAFAIGGWIFGAWVSGLDGYVIPWYCSLPAYLLFSICFSLSLCIGSTIPLRSALLGGLAAAVIGFVVLMFSGLASAQSAWLNMLLNFIIFGGGLGASIATVRMLAEKYFLKIMNGPKQGTKIAIHKWMNATGGGLAVHIGMRFGCEIQMNWDRSNRVGKEHAEIYIDPARKLPMVKALEPGMSYNNSELPVGREQMLTNGDTLLIGETIFQYVEND